MNAVELIQNFMSGTFAFIVLLGLLIFVHELGHFSIARWCGVRVEVFSLGFGKKIWQIKKGDTVYCLSAIPFGGYVKMFGEQPGAEIALAEQKYSFTHKTVWQRMAVVFAGPLVNFLFAIVVFTFVSLYGEDMPPAIAGDISTSSQAYSMGFRSGDIILSAAGAQVQTLEQLHDLLDDSIEKDIPVSVKHSTGEVVTVTAKISRVENKNPLVGKKFVGEISGLQFYSKGTTIGLNSSSPLWAVGLRPGDRILSLNNQKIKTWRELELLISKTSPGESLNLEVERISTETKGSEKAESLSLSFQVPAHLTSVTLRDLKIESAELYLNKVVEKSPAEAAGLKNGDRIVAIQGQAMTQWEDVLNSIKSYKGDGQLNVEVLREEKTITLQVQPKMTSQTTALGSEDKRYTIGIMPYANMSSEDNIKYSISNPFVALIKAIKRTVVTTEMMVVNLAKLASGELSSKNIGGIISIGQAAHETFKRGLSYYLHLMAVLSINLFILNLLPVPVLDGGHLVFYTIEVIKGSPLSLKKMEIAQQVGMVLLFALMFYAMYNDFMKFIMPG